MEAEEPSVMAAAAPTDAFWPTYGQMDADEVTITKKVSNGCGMLMICVVQWPPWGSHEVEEDHVVFTHDIAWQNDLLAEFDGSGRAYEHDLKLFGSGRSGRRPACTPDGDTYAVRGHGVEWETTFPGSARPYWDWDASDSCNSYDFTVGVARPENLALDGPADLVAYQISIDAIRGEADSAPLALTAQTLTNDSAGCDDLLGRLGGFFDRYCIGIDANASLGAPIASTATLDDEMPTCLLWRWLPVGEAGDGPDTLRGCGGDQDGDGWDDVLDCDDNDASINPGAIEEPNGGIDQDCDGQDLVVGQGTLQFTLLWDNDADMDLHVVEPNGTRLWYGSRGPTSTGGQLDRDDNICGDVEYGPGGAENIFWPDDQPAPTGTYRIEVREYSRCGANSAAEWILQIRMNGSLVDTIEGTGDTRSITYDVP